MRELRTVYHLMRTDLYERARRYSFLITLGFVVFAAYLYIPPQDYDTHLTLAALKAEVREWLREGGLASYCVI